MPPAVPAPSPDRVVVPVDGTRSSARSLSLASRLAEWLESELVIVSVIDDFRTEAPARMAWLDDLLGDLPTSVKRRIVQARSVATTIAEESADGLVCIATTAEPFDADGIRHTVTDGLVAASASPVVVVGPECPADAGIDRVVVAIDPDHEQDGLATWATWLAYHLRVPLEFVHVADGAPPDLGPKVRSLVPADGESVADRLVAASDGGLLAMGSHGRTGFHRLVSGSVGAAVIPHATAPVLILGPNAAPPRVT
jgi:nucleotide-binding universal stress UspA family protein